jgi:hypothetical protein
VRRYTSNRSIAWSKTAHATPGETGVPKIV